MDVIEYYRMVQTQDGRAYNTINNATSVINKFLTCVDKDVNDVTPDDVRKWISMAGVAPSTLRTYLSTVNTFFDLLMESDSFDITKNPVTVIMRRQPPDRHDKQRSQKTIKEVSSFLKSIRHMGDRSMFVTLSKFGLRVSELVCLTVADYDPVAKTLSITKHASIARNKLEDVKPGRKNGRVTILPIDQELLYILDTHIKATGKKSDDPIFTNDKGGRIATSTVQKRFDAWATSSGFKTADDVGIAPHWFRAFVTFQLQSEGCNPMVIDYLRGDVAGDIKNHYARQVLPAEKIRSEYIRTVPQFGL